MTDWWSASLRTQRDLLDVQRQALGAGEAFVGWQEACRRVADANLAAWTAWVRLWSGQ